MLTSYSDEKFVSDAYAQGVERRARAGGRRRGRQRRPAGAGRRAGSTTVTDASLRALDRMLLADLLRIEEDGARWRDVAETVDHPRRGPGPRRLLRPGAEAGRGGDDRRAAGSRRARSRRAQVLDRLGRGAMMRHAAKQLRTADDPTYERLKRLAHAHRPGRDPAARRGALGRAGRAIATAPAGHPRRVRRRRAASRCSS